MAWWLLLIVPCGLMAVALIGVVGYVGILIIIHDLGLHRR